MELRKTDIDYEFTYQLFHPAQGLWVTVSMSPPGIGGVPDGTLFEDVWKAYLAYLSVVSPSEKYRLIRRVMTTVSEVVQ